MAANKLIIGYNKEDNKKDSNLASKNDDINNHSLNSNIDKEHVNDSVGVPVQEPLYENLWGNDKMLLDKLNEEQLAERRLYTRAKYMQKIECRTMRKESDSTPTLLSKPVIFMVIDVSMSGIGIVSEYEFQAGTILVFNFTLDYIVYEINCEVMYCFQSDEKFRAGLKLVEKDKGFVRHLKILIARLSLQSKYGSISQDYQGVS